MYDSSWLQPVRRNKGGRPRSTNPNSTANKGYDGQHRRLRDHLAKQVAQGATRCVFCGERIRPGSPWHLAHSDRADAHRLHLYAGPSHARCNSATNKRRQRTAPPRAKALAFFDDKPSSKQPDGQTPPTGNLQQTVL